ncbi:MAG: hypothetical protein ACUVYA_05620 [Planctomycetota bacterium]
MSDQRSQSFGASSGPRRAARALACAATLVSFAAACGCGGTREEAPGASRTPPPAHPAMREEAPGDAREAVGPERAEAGAGRGTFLERLAAYGVEASIPRGWTEVSGRSPLRLGTFVLERAEGDPADAEVSVVAAKGSEEANVERWRSQFEERPEAATASREAGGLRITVAEMQGTFSGAGTPAPGTRLWGAIVRVPERSDLVFFKAWGPSRTMERWRPSFDELLASIRPRG